jgi:hypothetical protein
VATPGDRIPRSVPYRSFAISGNAQLESGTARYRLPNLQSDRLFFLPPGSQCGLHCVRYVNAMIVQAQLVIYPVLLRIADINGGAASTICIFGGYSGKACITPCLVFGAPFHANPKPIVSGAPFIGNNPNNRDTEAVAVLPLRELRQKGR